MKKLKISINLRFKQAVVHQYMATGRGVRRACTGGLMGAQWGGGGQQRVGGSTMGGQGGGGGGG